MRLWTEDDPPGGEPETIKNNFEPNPEQLPLFNFGDLLRGDDGIFANRVHISQHPSRFIRADFRVQPRLATIWSVPLLLSLAMVLLVDERVEFVKR